MLKRIVSGIMLTVLLVSMLASTCSVQSVKGEAATITVPDDYPTIQDAVNHADLGDTIFVKAGTYHENVIVYKAVSLIGQDKETTIIEKPGATAVTITADHVTLRGFTVCNSYFGVWINSSGCLVSDNNLVGNYFEGVFVDGTNIRAYVSKNVITKNSILNNGDCGILIWGSSNNYVASNIMKNNSYGVYLYTNASMNTIKRNEIVSNLDSGILFGLGCSYNVAVYNNISFNGWIEPHIFQSGIVVTIDSTFNQIMLNKVVGNARGLYQRFSSDNNAVYYNSFINNDVQVYWEADFPCMNTWDDGYPYGGNYWSDYVDRYPNATEIDDLGLWDTPYVIDMNNIDRYPLMEPCNPSIGDIGIDGKVDMKDIAMAASAFGSFLGNSRYNPDVDINHDNKIDMSDVALIARNFGKTHQ